MHQRAAKYSDLTELKKIWADSFGDKKEFIDWFFSNRFVPQLCAVSVENGIIVSCAFSRLIYINKGARAAVMSGVATLPAFRRQGIMSRTVEFLHTLLRGQAVIVLCHPINFSYYRSLGYAPVSSAKILYHRHSQRPESCGYVRDGSLSSDTSAMLAVYKKMQEHYNLMTYRSAKDFHLRVDELLKTSAQVLVTERNRAVTGYLAYSVCGTEFFCEEFAALRDCDWKSLTSGIALRYPHLDFTLRTPVNIKTDMKYEIVPYTAGKILDNSVTDLYSDCSYTLDDY